MARSPRLRAQVSLASRGMHVQALPASCRLRVLPLLLERLDEFGRQDAWVRQRERRLHAAPLERERELHGRQPPSQLQQQQGSLTAPRSHQAAGQICR